MIRWLIKTIRAWREWSCLARQGIPVFLNANNEVCLNLKSGSNPDPVILVSIPKSGTYLFAELLSAIGVQPVNIHIATYGFQDHRCPREQAVAHYAEMSRKIPCDKVLPLIRSGQFLASHFPCTPEILRQLKRFKIIFTCRDLRDTFVSQMRWLAKRGQQSGAPESWAKLPDGPAKMERFLEKHGDHYLDNIKKMRDWVVQPGVLSLSFEEIQGDYGVLRQTQAVQRIVDFLGIPLVPEQIPQVLTKSLGKNTWTYSGQRSCRQEFWSDLVESFFWENGARELEAFWKKHLGEMEERKCVA